MFPVLSEAARGERITVGQGYYEQVALPIGIALLILTGVGPLIAWRKASVAQLRAALRGAGGRGPGVDRARSLLLTDVGSNWAAAATVVAGVFVTACIAGEFWRGMQVRHALGGVSWPGALFSHGRAQPAPLRRLHRPPGHRRPVHRHRGLQGLRHRGRHRAARGPARHGRPATPWSTRARAASRARTRPVTSVRLGVYDGDHRHRDPHPRHRTSSRSTRPAPPTSPSTPGPSRDLYVVLEPAGGRRARPALGVRQSPGPVDLDRRA